MEILSYLDSMYNILFNDKKWGEDSMTDSIYFPNIGIELEHVGKSVSVFGFEIAFYGIIIAIGIMMGVFVAAYNAKRTGQDPEVYYDLALYAVIFSIIGARLYYVAFSWENYKDDLMGIFNIREGGLAIYGGVIAAIITVFIFGKIKKISWTLMLDTAGPGLILGQAIGRWGNFFNREAFGGYTDNIFAMQLPVNMVRTSDLTPDIEEKISYIGEVAFIQVHPTFLYESVWNLAVFIIMMIYLKKKAFNGEVFLLYLITYGIGRFWIEGLRTDQLLLSNGWAVSQVLAALMIVVSIGIIIVKRMQLRKV